MAASRSQNPTPKEMARRRAEYERHQAEQERQRRRRRRTAVTAVIAVVVLLIAVVVTGVILNSSRGDADPSPSASASPSAAASPAAEGEHTLPSAELAEGRSWTGTMTINDIPLGIELDGATAPQGVSSMLALSRDGYYNDTECHRLTTGGFFVLQCGDPTGTGRGGPGYTYGPIENAPADDVYPAGTIAMARVGGQADSMGSQFFVVYEDTKIMSDAAGGYTVLGRITSGLDKLVAGPIAAGTDSGERDGAPKETTVINSIVID